MAFTLNQFQSALNKGAGTVVGAAAAGVVNGADKMNSVVDSTFAAAGKAGSTVKGLMPATNKKVDTIAAKFNSRLNNLEMQQRVVDVKLSMLSQATGIDFPTDEEIVEALVEQDEAEAAVQTTQAVVDAVANPEMLNMFSMIAEKLFGMNPFVQPVEVDKDIYELKVDEPIEVEIPEPVKKKAEVKTQPKKEEVVVEAKGLTGPMKSGRKKLGRQAPLAE